MNLSAKKKFLVVFYFGLILFLKADSCLGDGYFGNMTHQQVLDWCQKELDQMNKKPSGEGLTAEQLKWGEKQLRQMLKDRPTMASYVTEGDDLWNWTVHQFAGEGNNVEVEWNKKDPEPLWEASTDMTPKDTRFDVRVTGYFTNTSMNKNKPEIIGKPKSGDVMWSELIWELFNVQKFPRFLKVCKRALTEEINRELFIVEIDVVERDTAREWLDFYNHTWIPHCQKMSLSSNEYGLKLFFGDDPVNIELPEDRLNDLMTKKESYYKYQIDGKMYDKVIAPYLLKTGGEKSKNEIPPPP